MISLRLLADDLTGALDSAAAFAPCCGTVQVFWDEAARPAAQSAPALAFDAGTRERDAATAAERLARLAPFFAGGGDTIRLFKVDSLLRGNAGGELLALLGARPFRHVAIAPALPFQRRITRDGRQMIADGAGWRTTGEDIAATLQAAGRTVARCRPGDAMPAGISLWDAGTDADLDRIVAAAPAQAVLWVGAAGIAGALARARGRAAVAAPLPARPLLGLIGTDHPAMRGQLALCAKLHLSIGGEIAAAARKVEERLAADGAVFVTCALPAGLARAEIETAIAERFAAVCRHVARPAAMFVSGGETLRHLATRLGATGIDCTGQFEPGAPISAMVGGLWDGMPLVSKSGAFGSPDFLSRLAGGLAA